jgi:hypothetical protein
VIEPSQFQVNEAWIAFQLNNIPVLTEEDGDFDVIAIMDAASGYILATEFVPVGSAEPSQLESKRLLKSGQSQKNLFPKTLYIPDNQVAEKLSLEAEHCGIAVFRVPEEQLLVFISEARDGFQEHVSRGGTQ